MLALRFTEEDLEANRDGYLTKEQRSKLNRDRRSWKIFLVLALAAAPFGTIMAIVDGIRIHDTFSSRVGIIGLLWIVVFGAIVYLWFKKKALDRDLLKGDVVVVEGTVQTGRRFLRQRGSPPYFLNVEGISWNVDTYIVFGFANGDPYAIYYAPHSKTMLSAEWLGKREMSG